MEISYRNGNIEDVKVITELSMLLYRGDYSGTNHKYDELFTENMDILANPKEAMFLAFDKDRAVGFAHVVLRCDYVEGTNGGTVGYLEGVYVNPDYRGLGIAKSLVSMCEGWAKDKGCKEFASDCIIDNIDSLKFHLKIGFKEANRIICFTKIL